MCSKTNITNGIEEISFAGWKLVFVRKEIKERNKIWEKWNKEGWEEADKERWKGGREQRRKKQGREQGGMS